MEKINKTCMKNKKENLFANKTSKSYFTSILKFTIALALFFIAAFLTSGAGVTVENGALNVSNNLLVSTNTLYVNSASGLVGIGTTSPNYKLEVAGTINASGLLLTNNTFSITQDGNVGIGTDNPVSTLNVARQGGGNTLFVDTYFNGGIAANSFVGRAARGTQLNPSAVQTDDIIGGFAGRGYGATAFGSGAKATLSFQAAENWTDTNQGTYMRFRVTPKNGGSIAEAMRIDSTGNIGIGTTSPNATLTIKIGGTTIADSWDVRSNRNLKDQIAELNVSTFDFSTAKLYSYKLKYNEINPETNQTEQKLTKARVGLMQDEIPAVCRVGDAVDTYCLLALAYVKIGQLEAEIRTLKP